jgi:hypothetical protein
LLDQLETFIRGPLGSSPNWAAVELARLHSLKNQPEAALEALAQAMKYNDLLWFIRWDPVFASLRDNPGYIALFEGLDAHINAERTKLGWQPMELPR